MNAKGETAAAPLSAANGAAAVMRFLQTYAVAVMIVALMILLTSMSDSFLTVRNL